MESKSVEGSKDAVEELMKAPAKPRGVSFRVDERISIKGKVFRIKSVKPKELRLKLVPQSLLDKEKGK